MQQRALPAVAAIVVRGVAAGLVAGLTVVVFLLAVAAVGPRPVGAAAFFEYVASGAIGATAYASVTGAWIGVGVHAAVSAGWGAGYAWLAARTPQVAARPLTSGLVFGFVVYFAMQLVEVMAGIYHLPTPRTLLIALVADMVFFGLVLAVVLRALTGSRTAS